MNTLYDFQKTGVDFMYEAGNCLNADQMGLGKTIQTIEVINRINPARVLIVCPATIKLNWMRELWKWMEDDLTIGIADGSYVPKTDIVIINYDILHKNLDILIGTQWDLVILDESHYIKNRSAKRTMAALNLQAKRKILLTGTPILNRPIELWTQLLFLGAVKPNTYMKYALRYCKAHTIRVKGGRQVWKMDGAAHLDELSDKIQKYVIRRTKDEVLPELPAKVRQIIELDGGSFDDLYTPYMDRLRDLVRYTNRPDLYEEAVSALFADLQLEFEEMSRTRHEEALNKVPAVIDHLRDALDSSGKVVCFAHHRDVIARIYDAFRGEAVMLHGGTSTNSRDNIVHTFQNDDRIKLFIGQIQAAGTGITLTASSHVVFAELDWVPGNMEQAEDRCHRIGQKDSVLVQHLVYNDTLEALMAKVLIAKQRVIEKVHNNQGGKENG